MASNLTADNTDVRFYNRENYIIMIEGFAALLIMLFSFSGNLIVCIAFIQHKGVRITFKVYSLSHAIADMVLAIVAMPFSVVALFQGKWVFASEWCSFQAIVAVWSCEASILTMTLAAIHRYTKMLKSPLHKRFYTKRFITWSLMFGWLIAIIGPVSYLLKGGKFVFISAFVVCTFDYHTVDTVFAMVMVVILAVIPFSIIVFCYYKVWSFVQQHNSTMQTGTVSAEEIKLTKLVSSILVSFVLCWVPLVIVVTFVVFKGMIFVPRQVCLFAIFMASTSGCINPVIHGAFFKECRRLLCCQCSSSLANNRVEDGFECQNVQH